MIWASRISPLDWASSDSVDVKCHLQGYLLREAFLAYLTQAKVEQTHQINGRLWSEGMVKARNEEGPQTGNIVSLWDGSSCPLTGSRLQKSQASQHA